MQTLYNNTPELYNCNSIDRYEMYTFLSLAKAHESPVRGHTTTSKFVFAISLSA